MLRTIAARLTLSALSLTAVAVGVVSIATAFVTSQRAGAEFEHQSQVAERIRNELQSDVVTDADTLAALVRELATIENTDIALVDRSTGEAIVDTAEGDRPGPATGDPFFPLALYLCSDTPSDRCAIGLDVGPGDDELAALIEALEAADTDYAIIDGLPIWREDNPLAAEIAEEVFMNEMEMIDGQATAVMIERSVPIVTGGFSDPAAVAITGDLAAREFRLYVGDRTSTADSIRTAALRDLRIPLIALLALTVAFTASVLGSRRLVAPIGQIRQAIHRMGAGDLSVRVPEQGATEMAELAGGFNEMAAGLEHSDALRRRLTNDVAHELRTPISTIKGYLEAAEDGVVEPDAAFIKGLLDDTAHLEHLVDDLGELARADQGDLALDLTSASIGDVLRPTVEAHRAAADAVGLELHLDLVADPVVSMDARRLRQVFTNLVANAIDHTPTGGRIDVTATVASDRATVAVTDTGTGIATEHLPHVFDRFYRVDEARTRGTGTGLGLAIARQWVNLHCGTITAQSMPGEGTTFTVELPVAN